jgi:transcriptional regulator with GAF, ATPase, and Fis domain
MLRPWPGNVRELLAETRTAAMVAAARKRSVIAANDLDDRAGIPLDPSASRDVSDADDQDVTSAGEDNVALDGAALEAALRAEQGNVVRAAARLGVSRGKVRRAIERLQIDLKAIRGA